MKLKTLERIFGVIGIGILVVMLGGGILWFVGVWVLGFASATLEGEPGALEMFLLSIGFLFTFIYAFISDWRNSSESEKQ